MDRPERSTGALLRGSDLDVVMIVADGAPERLIEQLDHAIYQEKYLYLRHPAFHEEVDCVVKRFGKLHEQVALDTVPRMIACKILDEAALLCGSRGLLASGKALLAERGIVERLRAMAQSAGQTRAGREQYLLTTDEPVLGREQASDFYTDDAAEELA